MTWLLSKIVANPAVLLALLVGSFLFGVSSGGSAAWWIQSLRVKDAEQEFTAYKQDQRQVYQDAVDAAKHKTAALETKVKGAENAASERAKENKILVDAVVRISASLRDATATTRRGLPVASREACIKTADTGLALLDKCQAEYGRLAAAADGHVSDIKTLTEAWPK